MSWVKLHRVFQDWEWYNKSEMVHLFIHLLINANFNDKRWQGIEIKRGQLITGRKELSAITGLSERTIRTCMEKLEMTGEIKIKTTNRFSIVTICKYDTYQIDNLKNDQQTDQQSVTQTTNKRPTNDQQTTTTKEIQEEERKNKNILLSEIKISDVSENEKMFYDIAISFYELFRKNLIEVNLPTKNIDKSKYLESISEIRKIIQLDNFNTEHLRAVFRVLQTNDFWKKNVQSFKTLRKQMQKLTLESKYESNKSNSSTSKGASLEQIAEVINRKFQKAD